MNEIYLPRDLRDASISVIIFRCANFFGNEVGSFYDKKMRETKGENWLQELSILRKEYKINLYDPTFVLKEPLHSDSPLREFLPKTENFYRNLSILKRLRNDAYHNNYKGDIFQAISAVELFFSVAIEIGVNDCAQQFANLIIRLKDLESGKKFDNDKQLQKEQAEKEKALNEDKIAELNEKYRDISAKSAYLERELKLKEDLFQKQLLSMNANNEELAKIKSILAQNEEQVRILTEENEAEKARLLDIQSEKEEIQEVTNLLAKIVMDDDKLQEFRSKISASSVENYSGLPNEDIVGSIWTGSKGKKKITLSVRERDLIDTRTNEPVREIKDSQRRELAEAWLKIRPSGGRIFVDELGNACTLMNDELIFLGRVEKLGFDKS